MCTVQATQVGLRFKGDGRWSGNSIQSDPLFIRTGLHDDHKNHLVCINGRVNGKSTIRGSSNMWIRSSNLSDITHLINCFALKVNTFVNIPDYTSVFCRL